MAAPRAREWTVVAACRPRARREGAAFRAPGAAPSKTRPRRVFCTAAPVVDAGHHLLAEIAPLGIAHRRLLGAGLLREVLGAEVAPEARDPRLRPQHLQRLEPTGVTPGPQQPLHHGPAIDADTQRV